MYLTTTKDNQGRELHTKTDFRNTVDCENSCDIGTRIYEIVLTRHFLDAKIG